MLDIKRIFALGTQVILVEFEPKINPTSLQELLKIKAILEKAYQAKDVEITNTYASLSIYFLNDEKLSFKAEMQFIKEFISSNDLSNNEVSIHTKLHILPVCYEDEFAMDLDDLVKGLKLEKQEIIDLHTKPIYSIYFLGFLPGFLYLGGLPEALHFPRKKTPRLQIPKGSVGIGGKQTGIYPSESPGGWQLIGNCPIDLFNVKQQPPTPFKAGDQIQFKAITKAEHQQIKQAIKENQYQHQILIHD